MVGELVFEMSNITNVVQYPLIGQSGALKEMDWSYCCY